MSGHAWSIAVAMAMRAWIAVALLDVGEAYAYAEEAGKYAAEKGFEPLAVVNQSMRGWAIACSGDPTTGFELIESGLARNQAMGMRLMQSMHLYLVADAQRRADRLDVALFTIDQALAEVEETGERFYEAELHRLRGELLAQLRPRQLVEAEASLLRAAEVARALGASSLEARAAESLGRLKS